MSFRCCKTIREWPFLSKKRPDSVRWVGRPKWVGQHQLLFCLAGACVCKLHQTPIGRFVHRRSRNRSEMLWPHPDAAAVFPGPASGIRLRPPERLGFDSARGAAHPRGARVPWCTEKSQAHLGVVVHRVENGLVTTEAAGAAQEASAPAESGES